LAVLAGGGELACTVHGEHAELHERGEARAEGELVLLRGELGLRVRRCPPRG
jgi:hypothetical protein